MCRGCCVYSHGVYNHGLYIICAVMGLKCGPMCRGYCRFQDIAGMCPVRCEECDINSGIFFHACRHAGAPTHACPPACMPAMPTRMPACPACMRWLHVHARRCAARSNASGGKAAVVAPYRHRRRRCRCKRRGVPAWLAFAVSIGASIAVVVGQ